jgi:gamma-tubulin complex component 5
LSLPPTPMTLQFADTYLRNINNPLAVPHSLTWQDILAEEPFEGQHWEGVYGLPSGFESWESRSNGSTPSLSPWDDVSDDQGDDSLSYAGSSKSLLNEENDASIEFQDNSKITLAESRGISQPYSHRDILEQLKSRQYWRTDWQINADIARPFSIGDPSTLGIG